MTGATSFVGRSMTTFLLNRGVNTHILVRPTTDRELIPAALENEKIHIHDGSASAMIDIAERVRPEVVFHFAGYYSRSPDPGEVDAMISANIAFGIQLLEALHKTCQPARFVNAGSYVQYFRGSEPRALNLYAASKQAFAEVLKYYADIGSLLATTLILFDIYGPGEHRKKLVAAIVEAQERGTPLPLPDQDVMVDLVHIDDVVRAFAHAGELLLWSSETASNATFFVSSGSRYRLSDVVKIFETEMQASIDAVWGEYKLPERWITNPHIGPVLPGWKADIALADGIRQLAGK